MTLTLLTFLPLLGALLVGLLPTKSDALLRGITLAFTALVAVLGLVLFVGFDGKLPDAQFVEEHAWFWLGEIGVQYHLGVDGLSILLVTLTAVLMPFVAFASAGHITKRTREFLVWLLVMETGMMGVFLSMDVMLFYFFWEVSLIPLYFILGIWGAEKRIYATLKFFLYTLSGSLLMLVAVIFAVYGAQSTDITAITTWAADRTLVPFATTGWLFAGFTIAFAIKVPLFPFHTWLADAHTQAPTSGSVILAGVLLKMGTYGLLRFGIAMFPEAAIGAAPVFLILGAFGIVYGAFLAMAQTDVKRLIACSSVSHLGFVVMGMFALTSAGVRGSVLQMVNHGLSTGLLFLLFGAIYERRHTRDIDQYGGLAACVPVFAFFWVFAMLASVGLPGLNGFVGEWLILLGTFQASPWIAAVAVTGVIFGAVYLLMVTRKLLFGPVVHEENRQLPDLRWNEIAVVAPLCLICLWIGVAPGVMLDKTEGTVTQLIETLDQARGPDQTASTTTPAVHEERAQ